MKFITNHARVLLTVARHSDATVAEVAQAARITERSADRVLADLQRAGYVRRRKLGRARKTERPTLSDRHFRFTSQVG